MSSTLFAYSAYGMRVASDMKLDARPLCEIPENPCVTVRARSFDPLPLADNEPVGARVDDNLVVFRARNIGTIRVTPTTVEICREGAATASELAQMVTGPGLGIALHLRGSLVLHASAVCFEDNAVGFLAASTGGKSTLLAMLNRCGWPLVTDDILVVRRMGDIWQIQPGLPQIKLWPDAATAVGVDPAGLPILHPGYEKRRLDVTQQTIEKQLPLRALYVLMPDVTHGVVALSPNEAFATLLGNIYVSRALGKSAPAVKRRHFDQTAELLQTVPVKQLRVKRSLAELSQIAPILAADLR